MDRPVSNENVDLAKMDRCHCLLVATLPELGNSESDKTRHDCRTGTMADHPPAIEIHFLLTNNLVVTIIKLK